MVEGIKLKHINEVICTRRDFVKCLIFLVLTATSDWEPQVSEDNCVRIWTPEMLQEGHWHHIVVVLNRALLKNSTCSVYVDGQHISTQKVFLIFCTIGILMLHKRYF